MDRDYILNQIEDFTAAQLFDFISQEIVTLDELKATGNLDATKRKAIQKLQDQREREDDDEWERARYGNEAALSDYITNYPAGNHVQDAKDQITVLERQRLDEQARKEDVLNKVRNNPCSFSPKMMRQYLDDGTISRGDLEQCRIPNEIIDRLYNIVTSQLKLGTTPDSIPDGYTEVYFWGLPGSGKTCVLSAVLSTAESKGYLEIAQGPGYDYAVLLKNIFTNRISFLPGGTPVDATQYLPFTLKKPTEKYPRSISLIELSGEIFRCFLLKNAGKSFPEEKHRNTFNSLIGFLNGNNRKIHFFFVDYEKDNKPDEYGYTQADYLNAAATFFNDKRNNLFSKTTDAIYIVITKSDLMDCEKSERVSQISQYLQNHNFSAFVNSLRNKCRENSINAKRILGTPFSLGEVYFQHMCIFDNETSCNIIDILMRRIPPKKQSILDVFNK
jgi:hypothetical protein